MLEFLPELFAVLKDEGYTLTEAEAAMFLPCLVEKVVCIMMVLILACGYDLTHYCQIF